MTEKDVRTRAEVQAQDIGPIYNHLALKIFEETKKQWQPPELLRNTKDIFEQCDRLVFQGVIRAKDLMEESDVFPYMQQLESSTGNNKPLTVGWEQALQEGVHSGIAMPVKTLYYLLSESTPRKHVDYSYFDHYSPDKLTKILQDRSFHADLLLLANAGNGLYGGSSSGLIANRISPFRGIHSTSMYKDNALTSEFKEVLKTANRTRVELSTLADTMGCPVRLKSYERKGLGIAAQKYCDVFGVDPQELMHPTMSAVVAGSLLVARCLDGAPREAETTETQ